MDRDEAIMLVSPRLYNLLNLMFANFRRWMPMVGFPKTSAGFSTGGSVQDFEDLEAGADAEAIRVLEAGWTDLSLAERTMIEMCVGMQPWVWTARPGVLESAVAKLEKKLRTIGAI